jgi:hypothetical protein
MTRPDLTFSIIFLFIAAVFALCIAVAVAADLPNPALTPGAIDPKVTVDIICDPTHSTKERRHTTEAMKNQAFAKYGLHRGKGSGKVYEVDHLVPLVIGGADAEANLWPQLWAGEWGARVKDKLEVYMWREVCAGHIGLAEAQSVFMTDWIAGYRKYVGDKELPGWRPKAGVE